MRPVIILLIGLLLLCPAGYAQNGHVSRFQAKLAGVVDMNAVDEKYQAQVISVENGEPDAKAEQIQLKEVKKRSAEIFPRRTGVKNKTTLVDPPVVSLVYNADSLGGIPPDNDMAISKSNRSVSVINSFISVHNSVTGQLVKRLTLYSFSAAVNLINPSPFNQIYSRYDPKVIYDPEADRFICVMLCGTDEYNHIAVGFSKSNKPDSTWNFYKFYGDYQADTTWFDFPSVSFSNKEFFLTGNKIKFNTSWQLGFNQTVIYQLDKNSGYNGDTVLTYQIWDNINFNGKPIRNFYPVKSGSTINGPDQYFLSNRNFDIQNDTVFLVRVPDTIGSTNTNLTVEALVSNLAYGVPPNGRQTDTFTLATNDGRILGAYKEGNQIQFVSTTVHPINGNAAVYHGVISNVGSAPAVQASYFTVDTLDFGYANISYAGNYGGKNNSIISFDYTGPNIFPGIGAVYYDGTQLSDMTKVRTGAGYIKVLQQKEQRWGDYMGSQRDWNEAGTVWVEGIYGKTNHQYGNSIAKLTSPFHLGITKADETITPTKLYPNPAYQFINIEFELKNEENLGFSIYDMQGRKVDHLLFQHCSKGRNFLQFNVAPLAPGNYVVKVSDPKGQFLFSKRFTRQ
jgi:hypothetical protein